MWLGEFGEVTNYHWGPLRDNGTTLVTIIEYIQHRTEMSKTLAKYNHRIYLKHRTEMSRNLVTITEYI